MRCVTGCGRRSAVLMCSGCWDHVAASLRSVPWLAPELRTTIARQAKTGGPVGVVSRSAEAPLPINAAAVERHDDLRDILAAWVSCLWEDNGFGPVERLTTATGLARWLLAHPDWCRSHQAAGDLYSEIVRAVHRCAQIVDRRPDRVYLAACGAELDDGTRCEADLYGTEKRATAKCWECSTEWDLHERQEWMRDRACDRMANSVQLSGLLAALGVEVASSTIRGWCSTGKLEAKGRGQRGRPLYRVGDVLELVEQRQRGIRRPIAV